MRCEEPPNERQLRLLSQRANEDPQALAEGAELVRSLAKVAARPVVTVARLCEEVVARRGHQGVHVQGRELHSEPVPNRAVHGVQEADYQRPVRLERARQRRVVGSVWQVVAEQQQPAGDGRGGREETMALQQLTALTSNQSTAPRRRATTVLFAAVRVGLCND